MKKKIGFTIKDYEKILLDWEKTVEPCYTNEWKDPGKLKNSHDLQLLAIFARAYKELLDFKKENI